MSKYKCFSCREQLYVGDRAVIGNYGRDLMCKNCFDQIELQRAEIREFNSHYSNPHDENPSGTWIQNWQTDNPNYE